MKLLFDFGLGNKVPPGARQLSTNNGVQYITDRYLPFKVGDVVEFTNSWYQLRVVKDIDEPRHTIAKIERISDAESSDGHLIAILKENNIFDNRLSCCFSWFKQPIHTSLRKL